MYRFHRESWVQKLLGQDIDSWTTSSQVIGHFHSQRDQLKWRDSIEFLHKGKPVPAEEDRIAMGTSVGDTLCWNGPWQYSANDVRKEQTLYKVKGQTRYLKRNHTHPGVRLKPIQTQKGIDLSIDGIPPAGMKNPKQAGAEVKDTKVEKKYKETGIPNNHVFSFKFKTPWKSTLSVHK